MLGWLDTVNCVFLAAAVLSTTRDILRARRDGCVRGLGQPTAWLLVVWPTWDLIYYWHLDQPRSAGLCVALLALRCWWFLLAWRGWRRA